MASNESILLPMLTYSSWQYQDTGRSLFLVGGSCVSIPGSHSLPSNKQTNKHSTLRYVTGYTTAFTAPALMVQQFNNQYHQQQHSQSPDNNMSPKDHWTL